MSDKIFEFSLCLTKVQCYYRRTNTFKSIFSQKAYCKVDFGHAKISDAIFSGQSLLLSTTVLNDKTTFTLKDLKLLICK